MKDLETRLTHALADALSGDSVPTPSDEELRTWLGERGIAMSDDRRAGEIQDLRSPQVDPDSAWSAIERRIDTGKQESLPLRRITTPVTLREHRGNRMWSVSAIASAIAVLAIGAWGYMTHQTDAPSTYDVALHTISTKRGERARTQLPDGSTVFLGPETSIRYASAFGKGNRRVELTGEALFTVTHADDVPFTVAVANAEAQVLGTTFSVRRYTTDSASRVIVAEGKVAVSAKTKSADQVILTTGEFATVNTVGAVAQDYVGSIAEAFGWTQGRLDFTRIPLREVVVEVSRMYGVDIEFATKKLGDQVFTGLIDQQKSEDAISLLAAAAGVRITRAGNTYLLSER